MTDLLFVYGTLMQAAHAARIGGTERARLALSGTHLGPASMPGRLYDLGDYPAMTEPSAADDIVHGEVYRLTDAQAVFRWLDPYEGISDGDLAPEYARCERCVTLVQGCTAPAWVYLWLGALSESQLVAGGRWRVP
ncbi:MAG: gamma-glutamylcyclotransferase family protein [Hyphomicrobiaceae bacterium]